MQVQVIIFGQLVEVAGDTITLENVCDTDSLRKLLEERYPSLQNRKYVIAVDQKISTNNIALTASSDVALLPPFSGG